LLNSPPPPKKFLGTPLAESKNDGTAEKEEHIPTSAKNKFENKIFRGTKRPTYQPETASAVLMKYLVESDKERQAGPPVDPTDAFFKSIAATAKNVFSLSSKHLQVKNI